MAYRIRGQLEKLILLLLRAWYEEADVEKLTGVAHELSGGVLEAHSTSAGYTEPDSPCRRIPHLVD